MVETYGGNLSTINVSDFVFHVKFWDLWLELGKQIAMYIIIGQRNIWDSGQINSKSKQPKHLKSVNFRWFVIKSNYRKVTSSNTSHLEALAGFYRWLMKWIFDPYEL